MPRLLTAFVIAAAITVLVAGTLWLQSRPATGVTQVQEPLPVATAPLTIVDHFVRHARYAGRIEARRATTLAFEQPGLVREVSVDEGARVEAGAVIARQDTRLRAAERRRLVAERAALNAEIALAKRTEERQSRLEGRGFSATQALDEARFGRTRLEAEAAAIDAAIARLDVELDKAVLKAPFAGTLGARWLDEGAIAAAGTPVVDLLETGYLEARIGLPPEVANELRDGDVLPVAVAGRIVDGRVLASRPDIDGTTRTVQVRLEIIGEPTPPVGALAVLTLETPVEATGFWVPTTVLEADADGLFRVPLAVPEEAGWRRAHASVEVLHVETDRSFVRGPVPTRAQLVIAGAHRVPTGTPVRLVAELNR